MANVGDAAKQLKELGGKFSTTQQLSIGLAALLVLGVIGYAVFSVNSTDWKPLFSNLTSEDAGRITSKLKDEKVAFKVSDDGSTVYVAAEKANEMRIQLASEGLPQSSRIGFELFDQNSFGATEFSEQVKYQRAMEGELERTIGSLAEVEHVRVHIVMPKESFFKDREDKAKASVILKLKSSKKLSDSSVAGVVHLVASSVQGLSPDQVSVVDTTGRMLARPGEMDSELRLSSTQLELRERLEKELSGRLMGLLEPVVGPGKVRVSVAADMNFARNEKLEEKFDPQGTIRSEQKIDDRESKDGKLGNVAVGTRSNQPQPSGNPPPAASTPDPAAAIGPSRSKTSQTTNYEVTHTTTRTIDPAGDVKRLSVSVIVDNISKPGAPGAKPDSIKRTPEDMEQIRKSVFGAIGLDEKRGDQLEIQNIAFESGMEDIGASTPAPSLVKRITQDPEMIRTALHYVIPIVLVLLVYILIGRPVLKAISARAPFTSALCSAIERSSNPIPFLIAMRHSGRSTCVIAARRLPLTDCSTGRHNTTIYVLYFTLSGNALWWFGVI